MRIGLDYRILAVGPGLITRGMGRYTQQQLRAVLDIDSRNEYVLLCNRENDLSLIAPGLLEAENVSLQCYTPPPHLRPPLDRPEIQLELAEHYQEWVYGQGIDVYHATTPFLFQYPFLFQFDACPMVATFYDLIPLLFSEHYFVDSPLRAQYQRILGLIKGATRLLSISDAAGSDAVEHLGIDPGRIDRAWPIPDAVFRVLPEHLLLKLLLMMECRFRLPARYILTVTYPHYSKNLETLLRGYAQLPQSQRTALPLVICCHLDEHGRRAILTIAAQVGVTDDIVLTGVVSDQELCALYNRATMVVHPSRYEGFGLPIAEAMRCGAPVVTTTASSLPEVAGDAAILVDPDDAAAFACAIADLARDPAQREALREAGFAQSRRFDSAQLGAATLASYERTAHSTEPDATKGRHRLAVWTPLPPLQTGIADYSAELLDGLAADCDVEVFVDSGYLPDDDLLARHRIQHASAFDRRQAQDPFDAVIYQVGGSLFHHYMSDALREHPGIVVLHDLMWSHVLHTWWHDRGDPEGFARLVGELEGEAAAEEFRGLADADVEALWAFLRRHPMLEPVIGRSPAQVVHLEAAADELRAGYPGANPWVIPMGVADPYGDDVTRSPLLARALLGLPADAFLVGVFGIVHASKRIESCIRGLAGLAEAEPGARMLIVGPALDEGYRDHLGELARQLGVEDRVHFTGRVAHRDLEAHLKAVDVILNLRTPLSTHMSATLIRALAAGRPVILNDLPEWECIPDAACRRIPSGEHEAAALVAELRRLAARPGLRAEMGAAARSFYEQDGTIQRMALRYVELVERVLSPRRVGVVARP